MARRFAVACLLLLWACCAAAADEPVPVAIARHHDMALPDVWTRLLLRSSALELTRRHLADAGRELRLGPAWNDTAPEWRAAEAGMVEALMAAGSEGLADPDWFRGAWAQAVREVLDADEARQVLAQLDAPAGAPLAATLDWHVGELVMTRLTFTDRVKVGTPGLEVEAKALEQAASAKLAAMAWDYGDDPRANLFMYRGAGRKYFRDVGFRMVALANARMDAAVARMKAAFGPAAERLDGPLETFRRRAGTAR